MFTSVLREKVLLRTIAIDSLNLVSQLEICSSHSLVGKDMAWSKVSRIAKIKTKKLADEY